MASTGVREDHNDTVIYTQIDKKQSPTQTEKLLNNQENITMISNWCFGKKLSNNSNKTKTMMLGMNRHNKNFQLPFPIKIDETNLEVVPTYKYLGITLNGQLTMTEYSSKIIATVATKINTFSYLKKYLNSEYLLQIYKTTNIQSVSIP